MIYATLAFPAAPVSTDYTVEFTGSDTARIYFDCARTATSSSTTYWEYNYIYGVPLSEGVSSPGPDDFLFDSASCSDLDNGPHAVIAVSEDALDAPAFLPFKTFLFFGAIFFFIYLITFISKVLGFDKILYA